VNLFYQPLIPQGIHHLDEEESRHCIKVLRKRNGDFLRITDGKGAFYDAVITAADARQCAFNIQHSEHEPARAFSIHIAISPTKNADRIEWFVEKAVEIGIDHITLLDCQHSERSHLKTERLKKVAISAMKQSIKATLPEVTGVTAFDDLVLQATAQQKFIAHVDATNPLHLKEAARRAASYLVLIGPEGDFSAAELAVAASHGFSKVSLGHSRLRTETAGMATCHILNLINT
jgi:16S rRNA (uracil1498-N3)-methyltransferase